MILNPIAIATKGVYANEIPISLASFGYIDLEDGPIVEDLPFGMYNGLYLGLYDQIYINRQKQQ